MIKDNHESFQKTNEVLSDMKNVMSKKEYDKLINDMGKNNNNNDNNESKNEFFKEEKSIKGDNIDMNKDNFENEKIKFEELQNRIKDEIKTKGNFDFNKLTQDNLKDLKSPLNKNMNNYNENDYSNDEKN